MSEAQFGRIIDAGLVEASVLATLQQYETRYLREVEEQNDLAEGYLEAIKTYTVASDFDRWPENDLPNATLVSPGLGPDPKRDGTGQVEAGWQMTLHVTVNDDHEEDVRRKAQLYIAALGAILMQHRGLDDDLAATVTWTGGAQTSHDVEDRRSLFGASFAFTVHVDNVVDTSKGPRDPADTTEPVPYDEAQSSVEVVKEPIT